MIGSALRSWRGLGWLLLTVGCGSEDLEPAAADELLVPPQGFPAFTYPADNPPTARRIALGRTLFYDKRLSSDGSVACASCHQQAASFADPQQFSRGVAGAEGTRNAPALVNLAWAKSLFWDGGAATLEQQAIAPIESPIEMALPLTEATQRVAADPALRRAFGEAYGAQPTPHGLVSALASFVRSLISIDTPYDRKRLRGEPMSDAAERGALLFNGERGDCFHCHTGFNLTNNGFHNDGSAASDPDPGRERLTARASDRGKFKVPTLRNVAESAPYMHDGSLATLDDVIERYSAGGGGHPNTDPLVFPLGLAAGEQADLRAFLEALSDRAFLENAAFADPDPD